MSYILDALRRADAERDRGAVPGLHSQPLAAPLAGAPAARQRQATWVAGGAAAALLLAAVAWLLAGRGAAVPVDQAPAAAATATAAAASVAVAVPLVPAAPPAAPLVVVVTAAPAALPAQPARASTAAAQVTPRITPYEQLPDEVKRQLPLLAIGGAIYSDSAASRVLIVGGQLMHEGDTVAPGLTLELIKPRSAVLRWKDLRYELAL